MNVLYVTASKATGGRDGKAGTLDGSFQVSLTTPKELGGPGGDGVNPEQLFATGYAACFLSAIKFVAHKEKHVAVGDDASVTAQVGIGSVEIGGFGLEVELTIDLPGVDTAVARELVNKAHQVCPYSNAVRNSIDVTLVLSPPKV
ncbi:MAG: organic hydroperoxide resistance protein [Magnetospiraceae bacterium]